LRCGVSIVVGPSIGATLEALAKRIGFRTLRGFGERVIYPELYLQDLR